MKNQSLNKKLLNEFNKLIQEKEESREIIEKERRRNQKVV